MADSRGFPTFLVVWFGDFISTIGSALTAFTLGIYGYKLTGQATTTAMIVLLNFLPAFLLRPLGGVLADKIDRMLLMIIGNLGSALSIGLIFIAINSQNYQLFVVYCGLTLSSVFFALQNPAFKALVSDLLPTEHYAKASGLMQLSNAGQFLISPILGGILISFLDIKYILLIDIATFIVSIMALVAIKLTGNTKIIITSDKPKEKTKFIHDIKEGIFAITANPAITLLVGLVSLLLFNVGLLQVLLTPMVLAFADAKHLGTAQSICGLGMLISSLTITLSQRKIKNIHLLGISLIIMGFSYAMIGIQPNLLSVIIPGFLFFMAIPYANSSIDVLIRSNIDNQKQGRVWSLISVLTYLGSLIAYSIGGLLIDHVIDPLFMPNGILSHNLGLFFGVGKGRGISFLFFLSGIFILFLAFCIFRSKKLMLLEKTISNIGKFSQVEESHAGNI